MEGTRREGHKAMAGACPQDEMWRAELGVGYRQSGGRRGGQQAGRLAGRRNNPFTENMLHSMMFATCRGRC